MLIEYKGNENVWCWYIRQEMWMYDVVRVERECACVMLIDYRENENVWYWYNREKMIMYDVVTVERE